MGEGPESLGEGPESLGEGPESLGEGPEALMAPDSPLFPTCTYSSRVHLPREREDVLLCSLSRSPGRVQGTYNDIW